MIRSESAWTQGYVPYQDMEVDNDNSLEEMGCAPSVESDSAGWHEPFRDEHMCATKSGSSFVILQPSWWKTMARRTRPTSAGTDMTAG